MEEALLTTPAESSPAESPSSSQIESLNGEQRREWLKTGTVPKPAETAPQESSELAPEAAESAPDSETGKQSQEKARPRTDAATRVKELLDERYQLRQELSARDQRERALQERLERLERGERPASQPAPTQQQAPSAKPKEEDFETFPEYLEALSDWKAGERFRSEMGKAEKLAEDARAAARQKAADAQYSAKAQEFKASKPDYDDKMAAVFTDPQIRQLSNTPGAQATFEYLIGNPTMGPQISYYLAENKAEMVKILQMHPLHAASALGKIEAKLELASAKPAPTPGNKTTAAPPPPTQLGTGKTAPHDEAQVAIAKGDGRAYINLMNARERKRG